MILLSSPNLPRVPYSRRDKILKFTRQFLLLSLLLLSMAEIHGQAKKSSSKSDAIPPIKLSDEIQQLKTWKENHPDKLVSLSVSTDKQIITIGEKFIYTVNLVHPPALEIIKPDPFRDFEHFTALEHQLLPTQIIKNQSHYTLHYTLAVYEIGTFVIPPAKAVVLLTPPLTQTPQPPQDSQPAQPSQLSALPQQETLKLTSLPLTIEVQPLIKTADEANDPFKSPFEVAGKIATSAKILFVVSILLILMTVIYWQRRRKIIKQIPPTPFYFQTRQELDKLIASFDAAPPLKDLKKSERNQYIAVFYDSLSQITRSYLSEKLASPSLLACTTSELPHTHMFPTLPKAEKKIFLTFLEKADWIKFSGKEMSLHYALKFTHKLYAFTKADEEQAKRDEQEKLEKMNLEQSRKKRNFPKRILRTFTRKPNHPSVPHHS